MAVDKQHMVGVAAHMVHTRARELVEEHKAAGNTMGLEEELLLCLTLEADSSENSKTILKFTIY